jgi:cell division protein YceG involved in septum cleavage
MQVFKINDDGTTTEISTDGPIKDVLDESESYVLVADSEKKVYLWKGQKSSVRSKFIGAKRSQEIRGQVGMHYAVKPLDQGEEEPEFIKLVGGKTTEGIAKAIDAEDLDAKASGQGRALGKGPASASKSSSSGGNQGPLYKGASSMQSFTADQSQLDFEKIMKKLEEYELPPGFERELIIIGNHAYSIVEKVQTFLGKKQVEKVMEKVGTIPEGIFFAEDYSPRILSENGKIIAIEFLKETGGKSSQSKQSDKKEKGLNDQIKDQLVKKKK